MRKHLIICFYLFTGLLLNAQTNTFPTSGKTGIGTTNPISTLHLYSNNGGNEYNTFFDTNSLNFETPTNSASFINKKDNGSIMFRMGPSYNTVMTINNSGNVGVGTTSPISKLEVEGRTSVGKSRVLNLDWTNESNWGGSSSKWAGYIGFNAYRNNDDTKDNYYGNNTYTSKGVFEGSNYGFRWLYRNHINFDSSSQHQLIEYMRLDNNGNLGLGTTNTQGFKLGVQGKIAAEEVKVATYANWSDFVFENNYNLPTLKEVEQHIKDKGHLKDIPSAEKVKNDGFFLGEMDSKLLQKIEELTLYTINQEKRINTLESENKTLKTQEERIGQLEEKIAMLLNTKQ